MQDYLLVEGDVPLTVMRAMVDRQTADKVTRFDPNQGLLALSALNARPSSATSGA